MGRSAPYENLDEKILEPPNLYVIFAPDASTLLPEKDTLPVQVPVIVSTRFELSDTWVLANIGNFLFNCRSPFPGRGARHRSIDEKSCPPSPHFDDNYWVCAI